VTDAAPVFETVNVCDFVWPSTTLPKLKAEGVIDKPDCAPLPLSGIVSVEFGALLTTVIAPVALPAAVGA